ncbi:MAG TPA: tetratricopeptide repeat protein [Terriglobia bacterium]|nr:tetratricopeptide repeat protein [Terriglobia bacterium]
MRKTAVALLYAFFFQSANLTDVDRLIDRGHWKQARAILVERVRKNPADARAAYLLSQVQIAFGDLNSALKLAENVVRLEKENADYHALLSRVYGEMAQSAGALRRMMYGLRFRNEAEAALRLNARHIDARYELMLFYLNAPAAMGGKPKARAFAQEIVSVNAWEGYMAHARLAQEENDWANVEAFYLKAVAIAPAEYDSQAALAEFYASDSQKKFALAEKHARIALSEDNGQSRAYAVLASVFALQQRLPELDDVLSQAEKNIPDDFVPYYASGRALLSSGGDPRRAERHLRKYLTQEPEGNTPGHAKAHWQLALALERQGQKTEAIAELRIAVRLDPDLDEASRDLRRLTSARP